MKIHMLLLQTSTSTVLLHFDIVLGIFWLENEPPPDPLSHLVVSICGFCFLCYDNAAPQRALFIDNEGERFCRYEDFSPDH